MTLNSMRHWFGKYLFRVKLGDRQSDVTAGGLVMGFMFTAMVLTTFVWNWSGRNVGAQASAAQSPDKAIATVGGEPITQGDFDTAMTRQEQMMAQYRGSAIGLDDMAMMRHYTFESLVRNKEQLIKARQLGITATDDDIDKWRLSYLDENRAPQDLGLPANASLSDLESALEQNGKSIDTIAPIDQARDAVVLHKLQDQATAGITATEQDAVNSYNQYHTQSILISNSGRSDVQAQAQAQQVLAMVKAPGADFAAIARKYSQAPNAKKSVDDTWSGQSAPYSDDFKNAVEALQVNQITPDLIKDPTGYYIVKLIGVTPNLPKDFATNKANYISQLSDQRKQDAWNKYADDLDKSSPPAVILDPGLRADKEFADAQAGLGMTQTVTNDGQKAAFQTAIADYQKAATSGDSRDDQAEAYYQMAQGYKILGDTANEIDCYSKAASAYTGDKTSLLMMLGDLYKQQKNDALAISTYQEASSGDFDDVSTHIQLTQDFKQLNRPDLAQTEQDWVKSYVAMHPSPPQNSAPGGPMSISPVGGQGMPMTIKPTVSIKPVSSATKPSTVTISPGGAVLGGSGPAATVKTVSTAPPSAPTVNVQQQAAPVSPAGAPVQ